MIATLTAIGLGLNSIGLVIAIVKLSRIEKRHADELAVTKSRHDMMWRQFSKDHGLNGEQQ